MRRTSIAFNLIQERYVKKKQDLDSNNSDTFDEAMAQSYRILTSKRSFDSPFSPQHEEHKMTIYEAEEESEVEDMDEGERPAFTARSIDIVRAHTPDATKLHLSLQEAQNLSEPQLVSQIREESGLNQLQIVSYGFKILVINDSQQNFFPVIGISISELHFSSDQNDTQRAG